MSSNNVIIIGAGIGGLATAARLAAKGYNVSVFEKNDYPGGKLGITKKQRYIFDTGPSLFTQPYLLEQLFKDCGTELNKYFSYQPLHINTHYFYEDGTSILAYKDHQLLAKELRNKLGIDTAPILNFLNEADKLYEDIGRIFLDEPIHELKTWTDKKILKAIRTLKLAYLSKSMHQYHQQKLNHPKLVQLFDRFATYNGSNPYQAPAMLSMIAHLEMNEGAFYANGGMISIPQAVYNLCLKLGVTFHFSTVVEEILVTNNIAKGIRADGKEYHADHVISNSDVYFTYKNLLKNQKSSAKLYKQERSSSAIIFYWGVKKSFPQLGLHNIFFSKNYEEEFYYLFHQKKPYHDPTVYINITSKMDQEHAPNGCENWFILINTPAAQNGADKQWINEVRDNTINKLSRMFNVNIKELIETESILTPSLIEQNTGSYLGALYGTASNEKMAAFMRHSNTSKQYKNLYFVGGTVHPGGGIPLCLRSAHIVANKFPVLDKSYLYS